MNPTTLLLPLLTSLLIGCSGSAPQISESQPVVASSTTTKVHDQRNGLIKLGALAKLPAGDAFVATPGYPGKGFHMGAINDATTFDAVVKAGGWSGFKPINWNTHQVVYLILDAQTNDLSFTSWTVDSAGKATLAVEWSGIEPFYMDATPAVIAVVPRNTASSVAIAAGQGRGKPQILGTIKL